MPVQQSVTWSQSPASQNRAAGLTFAAPAAADCASAPACASTSCAFSFAAAASASSSSRLAATCKQHESRDCHHILGRHPLFQSPTITFCCRSAAGSCRMYYFCSWLGLFMSEHRQIPYTSLHRFGRTTAAAAAASPACAAAASAARSPSSRCFAASSAFSAATLAAADSAVAAPARAVASSASLSRRAYAGFGGGHNRTEEYLTTTCRCQLHAVSAAAHQHYTSTPAMTKVPKLVDMGRRYEPAQQHHHHLPKWSAHTLCSKTAPASRTASPPALSKSTLARLMPGASPQRRLAARRPRWRAPRRAPRPPPPPA